MYKILITIILLFNFSILYGQQMTLYPLCFQDTKTCRMASEILNLPPYGNFRLSSKCRDKTPQERALGICHGWNGVLGIEAFIDLPLVTQFQWRNQCYNNIFICNEAVKVWNQLVDPMGKIKFNAECGHFNRSMWKMTYQDMKDKGIYNCQAPDLLELRVRAERVRL